MRENFSFDMFTDPKKFFMDILMAIVKFMIKVIVFGYAIYYMMKKTGLTDDHSIINYVKYLVVGSVVMYFVSIFNMIFDCYMAGTPVQKMSFMMFFKSSFFVQHGCDFLAVEIEIVNKKSDDQRHQKCGGCHAAGFALSDKRNCIAQDEDKQRDDDDKG